MKHCFGYIQIGQISDRGRGEGEEGSACHGMATLGLGQRLVSLLAVKCDEAGKVFTAGVSTERVGRHAQGCFEIMRSM